tara:strand:+ start:314 stop:1276 length:963 start_codon:yes stop_codon:yes gene_type:complete
MYRKFKPITDKSTESFRVDKQWKLNQSSTELSVQSYKSGSLWQKNDYHLSSSLPIAVSESYWRSLSFNFYPSASQYEGETALRTNHKIQGQKFKIDQSIDQSKLKYMNEYRSLGEFSRDLTRPIHLNKFGKNWIQGNVISISQGIYGEGIKPGSVTLKDSSTAHTLQLKDDTRGNLYAVNPPLSQSNNSPSSSTNHVGNVFYNYGLIVLKETSSFSASCAYTDVTTGNFDLAFQSMKTINTREYTLTLQPNEFMSSVNPSATDGSGSLPSYIPAESGWTPYLTTIGLYDDKERLIMVARLSQPIKRSTELPLTVKIRYDF